MTQKAAAKDRAVYLDIIRIIACFCVIVNHTGSGIFLARSPSLTWFASLTLFFISKPAVPLFIMISGALLLPFEEPPKALVKRILRVVVVLAVFSFLYFLAYSNGSLSLSSVAGFFKNLPKTHITNAFWYLYLYVGLLLILPLTRRLTAAMERKHYHYLFALNALFIGFLPLLAHYFPGLGVSWYTTLPLFSPYVCMMFFGLYIHKYCVPTAKSVCFAAGLFVLSIGLQVALTYLETLRGTDSYLFLDNNTLLTMLVPTLCVFYAAKYFGEILKKRTGCVRVLSVVARCTFGIYLVSDMLIRIMMPVYTALCSVMHVLPAVTLFQLIIFAAGFTFAYLLRLIPPLRKFI